MTERNTEAVRQLKEAIERTKGLVSRRHISEVISPNARVTDPKKQQRIRLERLRTAFFIELGLARLPLMGQEQPKRVIRAFPESGGQRMRWNSERRSYESTGKVARKPQKSEDNGGHDGFVWS